MTGHSPQLRNRLRSRAFPGVRLFDKHMAPGEAYSWHRHAGAVLTLVVRGTYAESFERCEHLCPSWSVQYKPAGIPHTTASGARGVRMGIVELHPRLVSGLALGAHGAPAVIDCGAPSAITAMAIALAFAGELANGDQLRRVLHRLIGQVSDRLVPEALPAAPGWLVDVRDRLRELDGPAPSLAALAEPRGVHPVHLARAFRRHFGCSVGAYVRRMRTDRAVRELVGSDAPLAGLSCRLGYHDQSHMTRDFTREIGMPPKRFRRLAAVIAV